MTAMTSNIYPSPTSSNRETASPQPTIKVEERSEPADETKAAKAPAKRKRENRYKNAPPSVLSVCSPFHSYQAALLLWKLPLTPKNAEAESPKPRLPKSLPRTQRPAHQGPRGHARGVQAKERGPHRSLFGPPQRVYEAPHRPIQKPDPPPPATATAATAKAREHQYSVRSFGRDGRTGRRDAHDGELANVQRLAKLRPLIYDSTGFFLNKCSLVTGAS